MTNGSKTRAKTVPNFLKKNAIPRFSKFKTALKNAPKGVQQAVKNIAGEKIMDGSLDSLAKIKAIDEILGTDLKLYLS